MPAINNGVLDGARRTGASVRDLSVGGMLPGTPLGYRLRGAAASGPPQLGTWRAGDMAPDRTGVLWVCTGAGNGAGATWAAAAPTRPGPAFNAASVNFPTWRRAVARVLSGTAPGVLLCTGDSTTEGDFLSDFAGTYPSVLTYLLNQYVAPAAQTWAFWHATSSGYDTRVSVGSNWVTGTVYSAGYWSNASVSDTWSYQPSLSGNGPAEVDTFTVYYIQSTSGHGTFTINVNGGSTLATVNTIGGSAEVTSQTVTFTATAAPTINIVGPTNSLPIYILGANAYLSTSKVIQVGNVGIGGSRAEDWQNTSIDYYPGNWFANIKPDLSVIDLGINDASSYPPSQYAANMQTIISNAKANGDVLLKSMVPSATSTGLVAMEQAYVQQLYSLAGANSCALVDVFDRWGSYAFSNGLGLYVTSNTEHPGILGCADIARAVFSVLQMM